MKVAGSSGAYREYRVGRVAAALRLYSQIDDQMTPRKVTYTSNEESIARVYPLIRSAHVHFILAAYVLKSVLVPQKWFRRSARCHRLQDQANV